MSLPLNTVLTGDCRELLAALPERSVNCVVTSPPYWGLRDYNLPPVVWGGDPAHEHVWDPAGEHRGGPARLPHSGDERPELERGTQDYAAASATRGASAGDTCACGAWRGSLGLEPTPWLYVDHLVEVMRAVGRVLREDGVLWLNLGDCYATGAGRVGDQPGGGPQGARWRGDIDRVRDVKRGYRAERLPNGRGSSPAILRRKTRADRDGTHAGKHTGMAAMGPMIQPNRMPIEGLAPGNLLGLPWRVAFAMQAEGWILRGDNIWAKPNPLPESVRDRPTRAHELVFQFVKSARPTWWRHRRTRMWMDCEPAGDFVWVDRLDGSTQAAAPPNADEQVRCPDGVVRARWRRKNLWEAYDYWYDADAISEAVVEGASHARGKGVTPKVGKNELGAHRTASGLNASGRGKQNASYNAAMRTVVKRRNKRSVWEIAPEPFPEAHFATFPPELVSTCIKAGCPVGGLVIDPFGGSGTVGQVAGDLGRLWITMDLSTSYTAIAERRTRTRGRLRQLEIDHMVGGSVPTDLDASDEIGDP